MKRKLIVVMLIALCLTMNVAGQTISVQSKKNVRIEQWVKNHFAKGVVPPFSFTYGGVPSKKIITKWKYTQAKLPTDVECGECTRYTYTDLKTELKVSCDVTVYHDFDAVEWVLHFTNGGNVNTPEIAEVRESDIDFRFPQKGLILHYSNGSLPGRGDFAPHDKIFKSGETLLLKPKGGRSSQQVLPFFNIESPASQQGVIVSIGWTGSWQANMKAESAKDFIISSGISALKSYLLPKESIRTSSVVYCFWKGADRFDGHNKFRRLIMAHHTRKINGKSAIYPVFFGFSWGDPAPCNEYSCLTAKMAAALLERQQMFGLKAEASWLDAGWYIGADDYTNGKSWINTVGNWTVNKEHFPNGLKEVSDDVHKLGRKFMVWFEPERVYEGTAWYKEHPEWLLKKEKSHNFLFNLGDDDACNWLCKYVGDFLEKNGIDYYRQDFNILPEPYWEAKDEPGRSGMTEVKYVTGLYKYWDYLLNRFPNLLIDNCASGGMRLDWETTLRSAPMWRTDDCYYGDPSDMQCHAYGINLFLPQSGTGMGLPNRTDKLSLRSCMGSSVVFNWKLMTSGESFLKMQECQKEFMEVRPYFLEDYYPLTGTVNTDAKDNWLAYELFRPSDNTGYVLAFRHHDNKNENITIKMHGLQDAALYTVTDRDSLTAIEKTGKELKQGLKLTLKEPDTSLLLYVQGKKIMKK